MTDDQWLLWFAGIMDGEGSMWVSHVKTGKGVPRCIAVSVGNTDKRMIDMIYPRVGVGCVWFEQRSQSSSRHNKNCRDIWVWRVRTMSESEPVIRMLYPFLVVKKEAADECLAHIEAKLHVPARAKAVRDAEIRRLHAEGETGRALAARFGIAAQTVSLVLRGHTWPSVTAVANEHRGIPKYARAPGPR